MVRRTLNSLAFVTALSCAGGRSEQLPSARAVDDDAQSDDRSARDAAIAAPELHAVGVAVENITPNLGPEVPTSNPDAPLTRKLRIYPANIEALGAEGRLEARAIAFGDRDGFAAHVEGHRIVLVAIDATCLDAEVTRRVRARVAASRGLAPEEVLLNVTHTHSAPVTSPHESAPESMRRPDADYLRFFEARLVAVIERAVDDMRLAVVRFRRGTTSIGANRRSASMADSTAYDPTLDVLRIDDPTSGAPRAIAFFHGTHPTAHMNSPYFSADFPGLARKAVERSVRASSGPGVVSLFFQALGGDVGPNAKMEDQAARLASDVLAASDVVAAAGPLPAEPMTELRGPVRASSLRARLSLQPKEFPFAVLPGHAPGWPSMIDRERKAGTIPTSLGAEVQTVTLGVGEHAWRLVATSHEVVNEYGDRIRKLWPTPERVTAIGYSNAVESYLPTQAMIDSDWGAYLRQDGAWGYEGAVSFFAYGLPAPFMRSADAPKSSLGIEDQFLGAIMQLRDGMTTATPSTADGHDR